MPSSGGGAVVPIPPPAGGPSANDLVPPFPWTILSIDMFAKIMGINPAHFWGATAPNLTPQRMPPEQCGSIYHQYAWQDSDKISRFDIAMEIRKAEEEISIALGYPPGLLWIDEENAQFPRPYRPEYFGVGGDSRWMPKSVKTRWGKVQSVGPRAVTLVATATTAGGTLSYLDNDSDGFFETAEIQVATTVTDPRELHLYFAGFDGDPEFEIREARRITIAGGIATLLFDAWLFISRDLYEIPTTDEPMGAIDISTTAYYVTSVEIYREYANSIVAAASLIWENQEVDCAVCGGTGCEACGYVTQDACMAIRDHEMGIVVPSPATYSADTGLWTSVAFAATREPDRLKLWYRAGSTSREWIASRSVNPLSYEAAKTIAHLATARFERALCGCSNVHDLSEKLRLDVVRNEGREGMFFSTVDLVNNPFGTKYGEVEAWRFCTKVSDRVPSYAVI